jgi:tripartite-type tricarboxylate transporter receptor subunit TctC
MKAPKFVPKALGEPMTAIDRIGAGGQIGTNGFLQQPDDGYAGDAVHLVTGAISQSGHSCQSGSKL